MSLPTSIQASRRRIESGYCPLDGRALRQIADPAEDDDGNIFITVQCSCKVTAWFYPESQTFELAAAFGHLIAAGRG